MRAVFLVISYVVCITLWDVEDGNESNDQHNRPDDSNSGGS